MTVTERIREVGLLRAAGARRGQVMSFMLTQALALGVIGSLLGLVLGFLLAIGMVAFVRTVGSVTLENPAVPLDAVADRAPRGRRRDPRRRPRAGPSRQPHPARRGAQGAARPAGRAQRPAALAGRGVRRRRARRLSSSCRAPGPRPASSWPSPSMRSCSSPPCSSRSCCPPSPGSPGRRSPSCSASRSASRAARSCAIAAAPP